MKKIVSMINFHSDHDRESQSLVPSVMIGGGINNKVPVKINRCLFKIRTLNLGHLVLSDL